MEFFIINIIVGVVATLHIFIFFMEAVLWDKMGVKMFGVPRADRIDLVKKAMLNQGVYNLFLAAGLIWSLLATPDLAEPLKIFFLGCVVVAGIVGGISANIRILLVQGLPAAIGVLLLLIF